MRISFTFSVVLKISNNFHRIQDFWEEVHVALLKSIIKDVEDVARTPASTLGASQSCTVNPGGGHPQIVEGVCALSPQFQTF